MNGGTIKCPKCGFNDANWWTDGFHFTYTVTSCRCCGYSSSEGSDSLYNNMYTQVLGDNPGLSEEELESLTIKEMQKFIASEAGKDYTPTNEDIRAAQEMLIYIDIVNEVYDYWELESEHEMLLKAKRNVGKFKRLLTSILME